MTVRKVATKRETESGNRWLGVRVVKAMLAHMKGSRGKARYVSLTQLLAGEVEIDIEVAPKLVMRSLGISHNV